MRVLLLAACLLAFLAFAAAVVRLMSGMACEGERRLRPSVHRTIWEAS